MKRLVTRCALVVLRMILWLRYRIQYKGLDTVAKAVKDHPEGIVFLANHPATFVDPIIVSLPLLMPYNARPLVTEYMFFNPLLHWVMRWIQALPIPNFSTGVNPLKISRLEKSLRSVEEGLKFKECFLIYPAGMTKQGPREILGGSFAVHQVLSRRPKTHVVLVRISGLWGSRFSRAYTAGKQVNLAQVLKECLFDVLKAGIILMPRRRVTVEFESVDEIFPKEASKQVMNRFMEEWYNRPFQRTETRGEPLTYVPYSYWLEGKPHTQEAEVVSLSGKEIPAQVQDEVVSKLAELSQFPPSSITPAKHLVADLCLDSLNIAEIITFLETHYDVLTVDPEALTTVASVLLAATHQLETKGAEEVVWNMEGWNAPRKPERVFVGEGQTIPDVFFDVSSRQLFDVVASDGTSGPVTYHKIRARVLLLAHEIAKLPGRRIGILLPASVTVHVLILACQIAGKTPVMINWTVGGGHLESVKEISKIDAVLTSWAFLDRIENVDLRPIQEILVILEELKATFSWWKMATSPIKALLPGRWVKRLSFGTQWSNIETNSEAVILFTSGTENLPKGVPLTHSNVLSNLRAALLMVEFYTSDRLLSALPPFHSFGFSVTGLLPLLAGLRVHFCPNPTDSGLQARAIRTWGATVVCSAPSFLIHILRQGMKEPFLSARLLVAGAEKPQEELFHIAPVAAPNAAVWEGYGITECSPILTINNSGDRAQGVGKPLPGVRIRIVDAETETITLPLNHSGLILASGPNVFKGYVQPTPTSPFQCDNGITWYVTGDIGHINEQGALTITGRRKRFVKIGGEMISLGAVESALSAEYNSTQDDALGPKVAVCAKGEFEGRPRLVLFSTQPLSPMQANTTLRQKGFSNLVRIDKVIPVESMPLSATGKVAYRQLEASLT